jgi:hypothetical protein
MYYDYPQPAVTNPITYSTTSNAISFTMSGKPKSSELRKMLAWLDECKEIVSQELASPSTSISGWTVNLRLERHGTTPTDDGVEQALKAYYGTKNNTAMEVKING